jgi:hypothetical protein
LGIPPPSGWRRQAGSRTTIAQRGRLDLHENFRGGSRAHRDSLRFIVGEPYCGKRRSLKDSVQATDHSCRLRPLRRVWRLGCITVILRVDRQREGDTISGWMEGFDTMGSNKTPGLMGVGGGMCGRNAVAGAGEFCATPLGVEGRELADRFVTQVDAIGFRRQTRQPRSSSRRATSKIWRRPEPAT